MVGILLKLRLPKINVRECQINIFVKNIMTQEKAEAKDFFGMKAKRESLGMTLKDVFALTRISVVNLEAIENGDFHALPISIYAKNFIKIYAQVLDLDSKPILDSYEAYWKSPQADQTGTPEQVPTQEQKTVPEREEQKKEEEPVPKKSSPYKRISIAVICLIFVIAVVFAIMFHKQQPQPKVAVNQPSITETTPAPPAAVTSPATPPPANLPVNPPAQPAPVAPPTAALSPAPKEAIKQVSSQPLPQQQKSTIPVKASAVQNAQGVMEKKEQVAAGNEGTETLIIRATEATWLKVKIDQNPPFQVLLKPGQAIKRKGSGFAIDIGNAGGVTVQLNGKMIENLGKSGEVRRLQLP